MQVLKACTWAVGISSTSNTTITSNGAFSAKPAALQLGYIKQFDYKINDETGRDFLVVGLYFELFGKTALQPEQPDVLKEY